MKSKVIADPILQPGSAYSTLLLGFWRGDLFAFGKMTARDLENTGYWRPVLAIQRQRVFSRGNVPVHGMPSKYFFVRA